MQWIAPYQKDSVNGTPEKRVWQAANQLRANSGLTSAQNSQPVIGLIFLRFANARFSLRCAALEKSTASSGRGARVDDPTAYHVKTVLSLPNARFGDLLAFLEGGRDGVTSQDAL